MTRIQVEISDIQRVHDVLATAVRHHEHRDEMNAALHLAPTVRFSPLTSELRGARDRLFWLIEEADDGGE